MTRNATASAAKNRNRTCATLSDQARKCQRLGRDGESAAVMVSITWHPWWAPRWPAAVRGPSYARNARAARNLLDGKREPGRSRRRGNGPGVARRVRQGGGG